MGEYEQEIQKWVTGLQERDAGVATLEPISAQPAQPSQTPLSYEQEISNWVKSVAKQQSLQQPNDPAEDKIGFWENIERGGWGGFFDKATLGVKPLVEAASLYGAVKRFRDDFYSKGAIGEWDRESDQRKIVDYLEEQAEVMERGLSVGAKIGNIVGDMLPFMAEFIATGGVSAIGKKAVSKGVLKLVTRITGKAAAGLAGRSTAKLAGWATAAGIRTALTPHRSIQGYIENRMPDIQVSPEGQLIFKESENSPFKAAYKAIGNQVIEMASEESGAFLAMLGGKVASKVLPKTAIAALNKLKQAWMGAGAGRTAKKFAEEMATKAGFNGILEEYGEERLGALMRAVAGIDDEKGSMFEKIGRALYPGAEQAFVELVAFSVPGVARLGVAKAFEEKPGKTTYSRKDFKEKFGIERSTAAERQVKFDEDEAEAVQEAPVEEVSPTATEPEIIQPPAAQEQETVPEDIAGVEADILGKLDELEAAEKPVKAPAKPVPAAPVAKQKIKGKKVPAKVKQAVKRETPLTIAELRQLEQAEKTRGVTQAEGGVLGRSFEEIKRLQQGEKPLPVQPVAPKKGRKAVTAKVTPAMKQHAAFKKKYPDTVILMKIGDFYEAFDEDAKKVGKALGKKVVAGRGRQLVGIPYHQLDSTLKTIVTAGHKVAVVEQTDKKSTGEIKRDIVRITTPGTEADAKVTPKQAVEIEVSDFVKFKTEGGTETEGTVSKIFDDGKVSIVPLGAEGSDTSIGIRPEQVSEIIQRQGRKFVPEEQKKKVEPKKGKKKTVSDEPRGGNISLKGKIQKFTVRVTGEKGELDTTKEIQGYPLITEKYPELELFVHKQTVEEGWAVSEVTSGLRMTKNANTRKEAIGQAKDVLAKQKPSMIKLAVAAGVKKRGSLKAEKPAKYGSKNKGVSTETAKKAQKSLRNKSTLSFGVDPVLFGKLVTLGAYHAEALTRAGIDQAKLKAEWTAKMVKSLGERIRPHLDKVWSEVQKTKVVTEPKTAVKPVIAPKKAVIRKAKPAVVEKKGQGLSTANTAIEVDEELGKILSVKNLTMGEMREDLGLGNVPSHQRKTQQASIDNAIRDKVPEKALRIATEVQENPRQMTDEEEAGLLVRSVQLRDEYEGAKKEIMTASEADKDMLNAEMNRVEAEFDIISRATKTAGTEIARALAFRRNYIDESYDILSVKTRARAAKGKELTGKETAKFEELTEKLDAANKKISELQAKMDEKTVSNFVKSSKRGKRTVSQRNADIATMGMRINELLEQGCI